MMPSNVTMCLLIPILHPPISTLFPYTTLFRSKREDPEGLLMKEHDLSSLRTVFLAGERLDPDTYGWASERLGVPVVDNWWQRSEEHTSELQSRRDLVCRLLLEKKNLKVIFNYI